MNKVAGVGWLLAAHANFEEDAMSGRGSTMMKDYITIKGRDGAFGAYVARPRTDGFRPSSFCRSCSV